MKVLAIKEDRESDGEEEEVHSKKRPGSSIKEED